MRERQWWMESIQRCFDWSGHDAIACTVRLAHPGSNSHLGKPPCSRVGGEFLATRSRLLMSWRTKSCCTTMSGREKAGKCPGVRRQRPAPSISTSRHDDGVPWVALAVDDDGAPDDDFCLFLQKQQPAHRYTPIGDRLPRSD